MAVRKTIRPITIRRVVEYCRLIQSGKTSISQIENELALSDSRVKEIARELQVMNLLKIEEDQLVPNHNTFAFLENFEQENWDAIHSFFFTNYPFYRTYINLL